MRRLIGESEVPEAVRELGLAPLSVAPCGNAVHIFTHVEWRMHGYLVECAAPEGAFIWEDAETILWQYAVPTAFRKFREAMERHAAGNFRGEP